MNKQAAYFLTAALGIFMVGMTATHANAEFKQLALAVFNYSDYGRRPPTFEHELSQSADDAPLLDELDLLLFELEMFDAEMREIEQELDLEQLLWLLESLDALER